MNNEAAIIIRAEDQASRTLQNIGDSIQQLTDRLTTGAGLVAGAVASVAASKMLMGASNAATEAFYEQQEAARGLTQTQTEYAASMQDLTGVQDEVTNRAMNQAKILGVAEEQLQSVTTAALGLSQATGQSLNSSILKVNEAINGNANAWASYLPAIRQAQTEEEKLVIIQAAAVRGLNDRIDKTGEEVGAINRRKAAVKDLEAAIGQVFSTSVETQNMIAALSKIAADSINTMTEHLVNNAAGGVSYLGQATEFLFNSAIKGIAGVEVSITKLDEITELITAGLEYDSIYWTQIFSDFATNSGESVKWLADNTVNIMVDVSNSILTIVSNIGTNVSRTVELIIDHISNIPQMLMDGVRPDDLAMEFERRFSEELEFNGLLDGFESQVTKFPDMIISGVTDRQQELANRMAELGLSLGQSFSDAVEEKTNLAGDLLEKFKLGDFDLPALNLGTIDAATNAANGKDTTLNAVESRLLTRGTMSTENENRAREANERKAQLEKIDKNLEINNTLLRQGLDKDAVQLQVIS